MQIRRDSSSVLYCNKRVSLLAELYAAIDSGLLLLSIYRQE